MSKKHVQILLGSVTWRNLPDLFREFASFFQLRALGKTTTGACTHMNHWCIAGLTVVAHSEHHSADVPQSVTMMYLCRNLMYIGRQTDTLIYINCACKCCTDVLRYIKNRFGVHMHKNRVTPCCTAACPTWTIGCTPTIMKGYIFLKLKYILVCHKCLVYTT